jgi:alkanesulfonate monooxygenase SsuD/methylene tetrahydromethanopterin reductase-like flavin-dependent oxidoreductase (luciferase family)
MPVLSAVAAQWADRPPEETLHTAALADELGYPELWIGETATYDAFSLATAIGLATDRVPLTIGPLAVGVRDPAMIAMGIASVAALIRRPVTAALGTSSPRLVRSWHGRSTTDAASALAESARAVTALLAGETVTPMRGADGSGADDSGAGGSGTDQSGARNGGAEGSGTAGGDKSPGAAGGSSAGAAGGDKSSGAAGGGSAGAAGEAGFKLLLDPPGGAVTVAAFGSRAVRAAAEHADRMVVDMVSVESAARLRAELDQAAEDAGRPAPRLAAWLPAAVDPAPEALAQLVRALVPYLGLPGYRDMFAEAGYSEITELASSGAGYQEVVRALPLDILTTIGLVGDRTTIAKRLAEYADAGVNEVAIVPTTAGDRGGATTLTALHNLRA